MFNFKESLPKIASDKKPKFRLGELSEVDATRFKNALHSRKPLLLMAGTPFCAPCKQLKPYLKEEAENHPRVITQYISIENPKEVAIANKYRIMAVPFLIAFKNKKVVFQGMGTKKNIQFAYGELK